MLPIERKQAMALTRYGEIRNQLMRLSFPSVFAPVVIRDADSHYIPIPIAERLVQAIWYDQRLQPGPLQTIDGRPVHIVFPGWWNLEAGPDFRNATVQIDGRELTGDVEIHLRADDWFDHHHDRDAGYNDVVLHVVLWESGGDRVVRTRAGEVLPQVVLQHQLSAPLETLYDELDLDAYPHNVRGHGGRCEGALGKLPANDMLALLDDAGIERFEVKVRKYARWIHRAGAEQSFYEGWMEALGYKANKNPFRTLAQRVPIAAHSDFGRDLQAILFGVAGLLPSQSARDTHIKRLWNSWWKRRPDFAEHILPDNSWKLNSIRPANHPHRRLGAAAALLKKHRDLSERTVGAIATGGDPGKLFLQIRDPYWSNHFTLGGRAQARETDLIGAARVQEIIANVILPFTAALAEIQSDLKLRQLAHNRYAELAAAPGNSLVRLAGQQLFGVAAPILKQLRTARRQQGLIQVFNDFCVNDKSTCALCAFPELAREWTNP
jgi:hypothetical protein